MTQPISRYDRLRDLVNPILAHKMPQKKTVRIDLHSESVEQIPGDPPQELASKIASLRRGLRTLNLDGVLKDAVSDWNKRISQCGTAANEVCGILKSAIEQAEKAGPPRRGIRAGDGDRLGGVIYIGGESKLGLPHSEISAAWRLVDLAGNLEGLAFYLDECVREANWLGTQAKSAELQKPLRKLATSFGKLQAANREECIRGLWLIERIATAVEPQDFAGVCYSLSSEDVIREVQSACRHLLAINLGDRHPGFDEKITVTEAAKRSGRHKSTISRWANEKKIDSDGEGGARLISSASLQAYLETPEIHERHKTRQLRKRHADLD